VSERERSGERACKKTMERERRVMERERSGERTKLAAQISLKGYSNFVSLFCPMSKSKIHYQLEL